MRASITVGRPLEELEHLWSTATYRHQHIDETGATVSFRTAPGDRGTEIHVEVPSGGLRRLKAAKSRARAMDELRRFKQLVETGEIPRSEAVPEGEAVQRKLKSRPAQPLDDAELEQAGVA